VDIVYQYNDLSFHFLSFLKCSEYHRMVSGICKYPTKSIMAAETVLIKLSLLL
jgi:hypothetical protein